MRRPVTVLVGFCAVAALVLVVLAATARERRAFTLGVVLSGPALNLDPRGEVCQAPISIPDGGADFDRVAFTLATPDRRPSPPVDVTLESLEGARIARGHVPGGYSPSSRALRQSIDVGHVTTREPMRVCLRNVGGATVAVFGSGDLASRTSTAALNGEPLGVDIALSFERAKRRSALSLLPTFFERMALWRAGWTGGWTYWVLAAAVLIAVPALVVVALRRALDER